MAKVKYFERFLIKLIYDTITQRKTSAPELESIQVRVYKSFFKIVLLIPKDIISWILNGRIPIRNKNLRWLFLLPEQRIGLMDDTDHRVFPISRIV